MGKALGIIGGGRIAGALGVLLAKRGVQVSVALRRPGPNNLAISAIAHRCPVVLIAVSDDAIGDVAHQLTNAPVLPRIALHTSGAAGPDALELLRVRGVSTGVLHPLQTVPSIAAGIAALPGSSFAFAGDEAAREQAIELIRLLDGKPLAIDPERWQFYHAAAVIASNYQVALMDAALELMEGSGVARDAAFQALAPLARQANANILELGTDAALTGPIRRGDLGTILRHVKALRKAPAQIRCLYAAAANQTLKVAQRSGLAPEVADEIAKAIAQTAP